MVIRIQFLPLKFNIPFLRVIQSSIPARLLEFSNQYGSCINLVISGISVYDCCKTHKTRVAGIFGCVKVMTCTANPSDSNEVNRGR